MTAAAKRRPRVVAQPVEPSWAEVDALIRERGPLTLDETAVVLGCSRERVRQIEKSALGKLARRFGSRASVEVIRDALGQLDANRGGPQTADRRAR